MWIKKVLTCLSLFILTSTVVKAESILPEYKTSILFITFDAGETHAFIPVIHELEKRRASFLILAMGTSSKILKNSDIPASNIIHLHENLGYPEVITSAWNRYKEPSISELDKALINLRPQIVISGVASYLQRHILHYYAKKGAYTFSFYDNFDPVQKSSYFPIANEIHRIVDAALVPSPVVQGSVYRSNVTVVGHPTVEAWSKYPFIYSKKRTREKWAVPKTSKILTFIGGYEDDYKIAFKSFMEKIKNNSEYHILFSPHPKSGDLWEKEVIKELGMENITFLNKDQSTPEAVIAADLVVCHRSTVGIQALFADRPVLFYQPEAHDGTYNVAVDSWELAHLCSTPEILEEKIEEAISTEISTESLYRKTGVPRDSVEMITQLLLEYRTHAK